MPSTSGPSEGCTNVIGRHGSTALRWSDPQHRLGEEDHPHATTATPAPGIADKTASPYISEMRCDPRRTSGRYLERPTTHAERHGEKPAHRLRRRRHHAVDLRHGGRGHALRLRPGPPGHLGPGPALPGDPGHGRASSTTAAAMGFTVFGLTGPQRQPEGRHRRQPAKVGYTAVPRRTTSSRSGPASDSSSRPTSRAPPRSARPSSTRPAPASTSSRTSATTSSSTSATSGRTCRAGTPTGTLKLPNPTYYLPSPNLPGVERAAAWRRAPLHDGARRLERADRGRRGHPQHRLGEEDHRRLLRRPRHRHRPTRSSSPYISELAALDRPAAAAQLRPAVPRRERTQGRASPAIVLDADDTTLWTYDMEVADMHFVFDPAVQDAWVQAAALPGHPAHGRPAPTPPPMPAAPSSG